MARRRLIDVQYFDRIDTLIIHEIVDGKREYQIIPNPDFHYYVEPNPKATKKETPIYRKVSELTRVDCKYVDRYNSVLQRFPLTLDGITHYNDQMIDYMDRRLVMKNHNLYGSDDTVELHYISKYVEKYKDEIDDTMPIKFMFYDIETHYDFQYLIYLQFQKLVKFVYGETDQAEIDLSGIDMSYYKSIMETEDPEIMLKEMTRITKENNENLFVDARFFLAVYESNFRKNVDEERVMKFLRENSNLKDKLLYYKENLGFPVEEKANSRIDAISFVDSVEKKFYMYLLRVDNDVRTEEDLEYITTENMVTSDLCLFIKLFNVVSFLKNLNEKDKDKYKKLLDKFDRMVKIYEKADMDEQEKSEVNEFLKIAKEELEDYEKLVEYSVEYKLFTSELDMIATFFKTVRTEIKPNIIAAHNCKFDLLTIQNRLLKYSEKFGDDKLKIDYMLNQLIPYGKEFECLTTKFKIDSKPGQKFENKSSYRIPGLVAVDTINLYAKFISKEDDFSLNAIAKKELKDHKVEYDFEIGLFYYKDLKRFIKYSAIDTLLLLKLEEKLSFIELYQFILADSKSDWASHVYTSAYITNYFKYEALNAHSEPYVIRNNLNVRRKGEEIQDKSYRGAYNTDLERVKSYGIHNNLFDLDFGAFYPSSAKTTNACITQFLFSTDNEEMHNDYLFLSRIDFANKYFSMKSKEELLAII